MNLPLDFKALLGEMSDLENARSMEVSVSAYVDPTAPADLISHVRKLVALASSQVKLSFTYLKDSSSGQLDADFFSSPSADDDLALIIAGHDERIGLLACSLRRFGVPTMVVSTLPNQVSSIAQRMNMPIPEGDLIFPDIGLIDDESFKTRHEGYPDKTNKSFSSVMYEPYKLDVETILSLDVRMGEWVISACPGKRLALALSFPFVRRPLAMESVKLTSLQNAGVGLVNFIPGADLPIMTLNQAKMLLQIAATYGQSLDIARAKELAAVVGNAFICRSVARSLSGVIPFLGWAVRSLVGYTGTLSIGCAAVEYFENGGGIAGLAGTVSAAQNAVLSRARKSLNSRDVKKSDSSIVRSGISLAKLAVRSGADSFLDSLSTALNRSKK